MEVTYYGHSCFLLNLGGYKLLFDPFISPNELAKDVDINSIKPDYILVSHAHEDHIADVEAIYNQSEDCLLISNWEIVTYFGKKGIENGHPMNTGGSWDFPFGRLQMTAAAHSSSFPDGTYGGNPQGFLIETAEKTIYYSGDTGLFSDLRLIGDQNHIDVAFLPIGDNFTMSAEDAVIASNFLGVKKVIGMHYDTFPYIEIDHVAAEMNFKKEGINLTLLNIGETQSFS